MTEFQEDNTGGDNSPEAGTVDHQLADNAAPNEAAPQRKTRKPRTATPKEPKLYPQWNEDGTPLLGEDGLQVQGETKMKKPKAPKEPKAPRKTAVNLVCGGKAFDLKACQNYTDLVVLKAPSSKEGSKRAERAASLDNCKTVQDFFINKGVLRDLVRYLRTGVISLTFDGNPVEIEVPAPAQEETQAE